MSARRKRKGTDFSVRMYKARRFRCLEPGTWTTTDHAGRTWEVERRRGEPGAPGGWYVFGPGASTGTLGGDRWVDAADLVAELSAAESRRAADQARKARP